MIKVVVMESGLRFHIRSLNEDDYRFLTAKKVEEYTGEEYIADVPVPLTDWQKVRLAAMQTNHLRGIRWLG